MKNNKFWLNPAFYILIMLGICLFSSVIFLMSHIQTRLNNDVKINLTEIVTQNKNVIINRLMLEMNEMNSSAQKVAEYLERGQRTDEEFLYEVLERFDEGNLGISTLDGNLYHSQNKDIINVAGRNYFKLAISGIQNISDQIVSRIYGMNIYVMAVPLYYNEEIIGSVQKSFTYEQMYEFCTTPIFSSEGYMYLVNSEGYVMMHTTHDNCQQKSNNFLRDLNETNNETASEQLRKGIESNESGFFESTINEIETFSAYTPLNDIHDWYLITSVPIYAVSPNGTFVMNLFNIILVVVVSCFMGLLIYLLWNKQRQKRTLEHVAFIDPVTNGNTFAKFLLQVEYVFNHYSNQDLFIVFLDIDNFKFINNYFGFEKGDQILAKIYHAINDCLREDECIARSNADQFVLLLKDGSKDRIEELLAVSQSDKEMKIYCGMGIYRITDISMNVNLMVDKARTAAKAVKGVLNQRYAYYDESHTLLTTKNEQMKRAIETALNKKQFIPFFQSKVDIQTGKIVGAEALAKWIDENNKMIYPNEFIPIAENTGLITYIDMLIFESVLAFLKDHEDVERVPISVNFSRLHLLDGDFFDKIMRLIDQYQVPPSLIEIEITESAIINNEYVVHSFIVKLKEYGFKIAMDDFGSGYSSLNMLQEMPIDVLKIDKGFLADTYNDKRREIIFANIANMAKELNIVVVVEGVENIRGVELMKICGCRIAQGFYYSKPVNQKQFEINFKEGRVCEKD